MRTLILTLCACCLLTASYAFSGATRTFISKGVTYKVLDAFAYETKSQMGEGNAILVRLSDHPLDRKALDATLDCGSKLENQMGNAGSVDLEFSNTDEYSGASYELGSGNGCG